MEFTGLTSASHMSLPEAGYGSEEGYVGSEISGAVSGVTTPGASRLQASQSQQSSSTMQRLQGDGDGEEERDERKQDQARGEEGREPGLAAGGREDREEGEEGVEEGEVEGGGQESAVGNRVEEGSKG